MIDAWIRAQANWHASNAETKRRAAERVHAVGLVLFSTTLMMALWHWLGGGHEPDSQASSLWPWVSTWATALAITLPAWGATVHAINLLLERERLAARSAQMATVLGRLAQQAEHAATWDELRRSVARAEDVMATENHEWWVSLSYRDLVLPG